MRLVDFLKLSTARTAVVASVLHFHKLDIDASAKRLRLRERSKDQGERELPPSHSQTFDAVEQEIIHEVETQGSEDLSRYLENQKTYVNRASSLGVDSLVSQIGAVTESAIADFSARTHSGSNELHLLRRSVIDAEAELRQFKIKHDIRRPPRQIGSQILKVGILCVIFLIETLANASFLQEASDLGFLGGFAQAAVIAFLNITLGVVLGLRLLPGLSYKNWIVRVLAALAALLLLSMIVLLNIVVAHYRTAIGIDPLAATDLAIRSLQYDPLGVKDFQSWMMFAVGILFSLIAAGDGWAMDDPYPGYGAMGRRHAEAVASYTEQKQLLLDELEQIKKDTENTISLCIRDVHARSAEYSVVSAKSLALYAAMTQQLKDLQQSANTLLQIYRNENTKCRKCTPSPARFETPWNYAPVHIEEPNMPSSVHEQIQRGLARTAYEEPRRRKQLNEAYLAAVGEYRKVDDLTNTEKSE